MRGYHGLRGVDCMAWAAWRGYGVSCAYRQPAAWQAARFVHGLRVLSDTRWGDPLIYDYMYGRLSGSQLDYWNSGIYDAGPNAYYFYVFGYMLF